jgi:hypothetical protein
MPKRTSPVPVVDDSFYFHIDYAVHQNLEETHEPNDFVIEIGGAIEAGTGHAALEHAGDVTAFRVPAHAPYSQWELCDAHSHELKECADALFTVGGGIKDEVEEQFPDAMIMSSDFLFVDMINVVPKFRGRNLGLRAFENMARTFGGGCAFVAYKPYAVQFSSRAKREPEYLTSLGTFRIRAEKPATRRVAKHWAQLGGRQVKGSDLWLIDLTRRWGSEQRDSEED